MPLLEYQRFSSVHGKRSWPRVLRAVFWPLVVYTLFGANPVYSDEKIILAIGDSLTAGYGLNVRDNFPSRLQMALRASGHKVRVINGGVTGDTTAGGLTRLDWLMQDRPDLVIVELGGNDALRGQEPKGIKRNLDGIIRRVKQRGARVLLAGMLAPPNMGAAYAAQFNAIFPDLADIHNVPLYRFFLDGVVRDPTLKLPDGLHPNAAGIAVIVERILPIVERALMEEQK